MKSGISPRLALVIISSMFLLPLVLAWLMYSGALEFNPASTRNLGLLVQPPVPVDLQRLSRPGDDLPPLSELEEHWVVLHVVPENCGETCMAAVTALRQVHRAAGRNQARVRILLLTEDAESADALYSVYPAFYLATSNDDTLSGKLRDIATQQSESSDAEGATYLIDPLGNIMMFYEAGSDPNNLKKDLKRLLTWSKLDEQQ